MNQVYILSVMQEFHRNCKCIFYGVMYSNVTAKRIAADFISMYNMGCEL